MNRHNVAERGGLPQGFWAKELQCGLRLFMQNSALKAQIAENSSIPPEFGKNIFSGGKNCYRGAEECGDIWILAQAKEIRRRRKR